MRNFLLATVFIALAPAATYAEDAYSTDQLVEFFVTSQDMGAARGICIGTAQECATPKPKGLDMRVTFELDSTDLTSETQKNLKTFADMMSHERLKSARFVVEGHTDERGGETYNQSLSEKRAASVVSYLSDLGVDPARLSAIGFGETKPRVDDGLDGENRRVEMRLDLQ